MRRISGLVAWLIILAAIIILLLTWQYVGYRLVNRTLPTGMTMAGLSAAGMTREQALNTLQAAFATPIEITYDQQPLSLSPDSVGLRFDIEKTTANLDAVLAEQRGLEGFIAYILRRSPGPVEVPVAVSYSDEQLDEFLARVMSQYDRPPQEPVAIPVSLAFRPGQPGYELDIEASRARLDAALTSATDHRVELVVRREEAPPLDLDMLEEMLRSLVGNHEGLVAGIFVKDLQTGDELAINGDVAFGGVDTLKVAILVETYRILEAPLDPDVTAWISDTLGANGSDSTASLLLRDVLGGGDSYQGVENLTASMHHLGLVNTFMAIPYGEDVTPPTIVTPANSRTDITTEPDPSRQTTPLDMGLLLEMIYQCSQGGGSLMVAYPDTLTSSECSQMIDWMSGNRIDSLIEAGVPVETKVAHKHGLTSDTHADVGLVFGPDGDFVLAVFLYRPQWLDWEESAPLIADITTATYNYFNPAQ